MGRSALEGGWFDSSGGEYRRRFDSGDGERGVGPVTWMPGRAATFKHIFTI